MRLFGREFKFGRKKAAALNGVDSNRGWLTIFDSRIGAWQADVSVDQEAVMANWAVFACMTLIAGDVGKLPLRLMQRGTEDGIWRETESPSFSPVLAKPNNYQTRQQFFESWMFSKLGPGGNTYVLKERDQRRVVKALHVLDPQRVRPLVSDSGEVFYELNDDALAGIFSDIPAIPASEIIHDRGPCLFHPLVGLSPIYACGLAATQGLKIQSNSATFFQNMSRPSGILTAPGLINDATATRIKESWEKNFGGDKIGKVAVLGNDLKYQAMSVTPLDAQMVDQLKITSEMVCTTFHVPPYKVGIGSMPTYQNAEVLNQIYYGDCLQVHIEAIEALLDEGLGLTAKGLRYGVEFDLDSLLRMDSKTLAEVEGTKVQRGISAPNESRRKFNLPPVEGGMSPYLQQQNYSLEALAKRDASDDPFGTAKPGSAPASDAESPEDPEEPEDTPEDDAEDAAEDAAEKRMAELQDLVVSLREAVEQSRQRAEAADQRRSAQLAELLGGFHAQLEQVQEAQQAAERRSAEELAAVQRLTALDLFAKELECPTTPTSNSTTH